MAFRTLAVILVFAHAAHAENVTSPTENMTKGQVSQEGAWSNFLYCDCGFSCQHNVGKHGSFDLGQGCACKECIQLRGSYSKASSVPEEDNAMKFQADFFALLSENSREWEGATVPGSNLAYCQCGSDASGSACRSCARETPTAKSSTSCCANCRCGVKCLKFRLWGIQGAAGWCVERACKPCR